LVQIQQEMFVRRLHPIVLLMVFPMAQVNVDQLIAYEEGDLDIEQTLDLFQSLIDTGMAWHLQGGYGRVAKALIDDGYCFA
jgi:hypothetical protein